MESGDGFTLVKRGKKRCGKEFGQRLNSGDGEQTAGASMDVDSFAARLDKLKAQLYTFVDLLLTKNLVTFFSQHNELDIVCYGLGKFSRCHSACCQLALLLTLCEKLKKRSKIVIKFIKCFDPVFDSFEKAWLSKNFLISPSSMTNDRCLHFINERFTLFYMPHSGRPMYNNVLYANWTAADMSKICIIGNSFSTIADQSFQSKNSKSLKNLFAVVEHKLVKEVELPDFVAQENAFNDTSIHTFDEIALKEFDFKKHFFEKPVYDSITEIILD